MRSAYFTFAVFSLFLTACGSKPVSYLPKKSSPIVNIESDIAPKVALDTDDDRFTLTNTTAIPLGVAYKLFWYNKDGVTQPFTPLQDGTPWQQLWLKGNQTQTVSLTKPSAESENYRLYLRAVR